MPTDWDDLIASDQPSGFRPESAEYYAGFTGVIRELSGARARGFEPTERQLILALTHAARVYASARSGKPIGGRSPDWLRGRLDGLRESLRRDALSRTQAD
ncbi:MAG TPA: hypothetical protein VF725_08495 [Ktedonobacterales bacterium]|jgi:hypothetical protein